MPRTYKGKLGVRTYLDYTKETIENTLRDIPRLEIKGDHRVGRYTTNIVKTHQKTWKTIMVYCYLVHLI